MVWTGTISSSESTDRLQWDGKDANTQELQQRRNKEDLVSSLSTGRFLRLSKIDIKIQQQWERRSSADIVEYWMWCWLKRITFVQIFTLHKTKHCLEIQLLRGTWEIYGSTSYINSLSDLEQVILLSCTILAHLQTTRKKTQRSPSSITVYLKILSVKGMLMYPSQGQSVL